MASAALLSSANRVRPASVPLNQAPTLRIVDRSADAKSAKTVAPATPLPPNADSGWLLAIVAVPAPARPLNSVRPPCASATPAKFSIVALPALALPPNTSCPPSAPATAPPLL